MPQLLSLRDSSGGIRAVVGFRNASSEPLFLDHYTGGPIEGLLAGTLGQGVGREEIVEESG